MSLHMKYGGLPHNGDPYSQRNLEQASEQVNQGAVEAKKRFDWLNVHRWLLTGHLMYNDESFVSEVWRSLHSPAAQLEYIISVGRSLSEIVHCGIELKDAIRKRNTEISPLQREDETRDELRMQINVLTRNVPAMLSGYWEKLLQVSIESSSLAPLCLPQLLHQKVRSVTAANRDSDGRLLQMGEETQRVLNEIGIMLSYVQDAIGHDIHIHSLRAAAMLETIEAKLGNRPQSVASVQLRDMSL
ncbi:hypothetical protein LSAT2_006534 [Lamellibrachia satsuma]|nr:hypothetical protein LSAT2_006534 [Lamellibrachia satsuma]